MIIALAGKGASGKSTVARMLAEKLQLRHYSIGDLMRELAVQRGMALLDLNKAAETDASIDKWLDSRQEGLGKTEDNFIIDSRLAFTFIPHAIKIFLDVDDIVAAKRLLSAPPRHGEPAYASVDEARAALIARRQSEVGRLRKQYGVDPYDKKHYDLIVDTTARTPEAVCDEILSFLKKRKAL